MRRYAQSIQINDSVENLNNIKCIHFDFVNIELYDKQTKQKLILSTNALQYATLELNSNKQNDDISIHIGTVCD